MTTNFPKRIAEPKMMGALEMAGFDRLSKDNYRRWMLPLADNFAAVSKLKTGEILDVACGPGLLVKELAGRLPGTSVTGIDYSSHALKLAKKNCRVLKNVRFRKMDAYRLNFPDNSFDGVVCKDSLHHFDRPGQAILEMLRVLKPGGMLYLQDMRRDLPKYLLMRAIPPDTVVKKLQYYSTRAAYTKREIAGMLKKIGLKYFDIKTKTFSRAEKLRYQGLGVSTADLIAAAQSRYILTLKK